jgi:signal peptidase II
MTGRHRKSRVFWPICLLLVLADCSSKDLVVERFGPPHVPHEVIDGVVRFTLAYNPDAAMGLSLGPFSRVGFALAALIGLVVIATIYRRVPAQHTWHVIALALIGGGAAGNLLDRLRSTHGVVDFIDVGIGDHRFWWVFNIADLGVTVGAGILAWIAWRADTTAAGGGGGATPEAG